MRSISVPVQPIRTFAVNLAQQRRRRGMSMDDLARAGRMSTIEIARLEHGMEDPRLTTIAQLARALDAPLTDLLADV